MNEDSRNTAAISVGVNQPSRMPTADRYRTNGEAKGLNPKGPIHTRFPAASDSEPTSTRLARRRTTLSTKPMMA